MRKRLSGVVIALGLAVLAACQTTREPSRPVSLAISDVTVIDPETRTVRPHHTVYVDGDRIVAVLPSRSRSLYAPARTIAGAGRFLIPGLLDMHVHLFLPEPAAPSLNLLLANGVTGMREMSGDCWEVAPQAGGCIGDYRALARRIKAGEVAGPDIVRIAGTMVMGPTRLQLPAGLPSYIVPTTAADARTLVRHLHGRGIDLIKSHDSIPPVAFAALADEARILGIEVSGHVPFEGGIDGATAKGFRTIEHARDLLYDCSRYGPEFRRAESAFAQGKTGSARPAGIARLTRTVAEFDPGLCGTTLRLVAGRGAFYTPTHVTREMEARASDPAYRSDPTRRYVMPDRNKRWEGDLTETAAAPMAEREAFAGFFRHGLKVTGLAHRAGVAIMAGTDASDTMIVPGFSLHRELALLAEAGLPPMDVLRAATSVPAAYLGRTDVYGGVSAGKEADVVLLDANPLDDIGNASRIAAVIANGRVFDRAALDALLAQVAAMARAP